MWTLIQFVVIGPLCFILGVLLLMMAFRLLVVALPFLLVVGLVIWAMRR
ncbi:hypothetical protein [Candidatus Thalassolituus haligoni]|jgi:hypothetical protein|tara:strand:- start:6836 stop:6982 length:147 start_codon:yes stop_codon:yes gene_type:complete